MGQPGAASTGEANSPLGPRHPLPAEAQRPSRPDLPARQTSFVGRAIERAELGELLAAPGCRLLTLIGPGGVGKTSLAVEIAATARKGFADGVAFAALGAVTSGESLAAALAAALGCPLTGREDARGQVARFLQPANLLLVLDGFEHLLDQAPWLGELLTAAPGLRLLVTSRAALDLREEWRYPLAGLAVPADEAGGPDQAEAVRLFADRARQARPDFSLREEWDAVVRLCRGTEGHPLALELAAAWVATLPCRDIAEEIERNLAFLATDMRNVPARHRSMRAAFDHSWASLTPDERRVFRRLAPFRGGFTREAAAQVAGASLPLLSALLGKSLVRREAGGRYGLHELLRQYADEHLRAAPDEAPRVEAAHREFYLTFVAARAAPITGGGQREAVGAIGDELDNIRAAWRSAVAAGDAGAIGRAAHPLTLFFYFRARDSEGLALLEEGLPILRAATAPPAGLALAALLVDTARFHHRLGRLPAMRAALEESEARYARLAAPPVPGLMTDPLVWRGILALIDGRYAEAALLGAEAVRRNTEADRPGNLAPAWWVRTVAALWQEDLDAAGEYARRSAEASVAIGDRWYLAYAHNQQGHVAIARGDLAGARRHYEASYALREEFDDPEGMATALVYLAKIAALRGDRAEAAGLYGRSLAAAREIGDRVTLALALNGLGLVACAEGDYATAGRYLAEGVRAMAAPRSMRLLLALVGSAGDWLLQTGRPAEAAGPLALARDHPASDHETRARARRLLAATAIPAGAREAALARAREVDPVELASRLLPVLEAPPPATPAPSAPPAGQDEIAAPAPSPSSPRPHADPLVEPLTDRELAVLRLIAVGRSNREIADELFLALNTVRSYTQQLYGKLGVGSRTQAVARARELGLLA